MTVRRVHVCKNCGKRYTLQYTGRRASEFNNGATRNHCQGCAPKYRVKPKPRGWKWVPTDEVTKEQMFAWSKEDWEGQQRKSREGFHIPVRRSYMGLVKADGSDFQEAIWSHGYRMVYWIQSREMVSIHKRVDRSLVEMLVSVVLGRLRFRLLFRRIRSLFLRRKKRKKKKMNALVRVQPMKSPVGGIFFFDHKYEFKVGSRED